MKHLTETEFEVAKDSFEPPVVSLIKENNQVGFFPKEKEDDIWVDLGLPSDLKWAKMNLGATSETEYGDYYMWGSVTPNDNDDCSLGTYPWEEDTSHMPTLDAEHDVAQVEGVGRMPTKVDFKELLDNTTYKWMENYQGSGVNGSLFTASNGNSIFIPASGFRSYSSFYHQGKYAYVWSSSLNADFSIDAWGLFFDSDHCGMGNDDRCNGFSIRPVLD